MAIAFFDLDRTLLEINSGSGWVKFEHRHGHLSTLDLIRATGWLLRYHLGFANIEGAIRLAISRLEGTLEHDIDQRTQQFYRQEVAHRFRRGAAATLEKHRAAGHPLVLLTTSSNYLSAPVLADLELDHALCNRFETDDQGRFTGRPVEPLCFGAGKVAHAARLAAELNVHLRDCSFYTDSVSDLPMLEAVDHPVVVNPDPKLARIARKRGWPIEDWGTASAR